MRPRVLASWLLITGAVVGGLLTAALRLNGNDVPGSAAELIPVVVGSALAATLVVRVPENRMGLLVSLIIFTAANLDLTTPLVDWALDVGHEDLAVVLTNLADLIFVVLIVSLLVLIPLWFPTGRAIGPRWEWVWRVAIITIATGTVVSLFAEETCVRIPDNFHCEQWATTPWGVTGWTEDMFNWAFMLGFAMTVPAIWSLVLRFRRAIGVEREQLRWLLFASCLLSVVFFTQIVAVEVFDWQPGWFTFLFGIMLTAFVASVAMAVLKYRLYDIDRIISRTVTYSLVVGLSGVVFAAGVVWIPSLLGLEESPILVAGTTLAVAALFNPVRRRLQRMVDHRFNRSRYDAELVMIEFAGSLRDELDPSGLMDGWLGVVSSTMQPSRVGIWVKGDDFG